MFGKLFLSISFFFTTLSLLFFSMFFLQYTFDKKNNFLFSRETYTHYLAQPRTQYANTDFLGVDVRVEAVERFLKNNNSPLTPFARYIVASSQENELDWRLLPAIAMQESNLCKKVPKGSHNCWGYGIYGGRVLGFSNFPEAIDAVARGLSKNYTGRGLVTPEEIMTRYTPNNTNNWASGVQFFMDQMKLF